MASLYVSPDELRTVAQSLQTKRTQLQNIYNTKVRSIMEQSKEAIQISGLDFNEFNTQFANAFTTLEDRLNTLSTALTNQIIPNYESLNSSIVKAFNIDFANQMNDILRTLK